MESATLFQLMELQKALWEKNKDRWEPMEPLYARESILWMIEELGEVIAIIKKRGEAAIQSDASLRADFTEEMCDVLMYYLDALNRYDISAEELTAAFLKKHRRNMTRDFEKEHRNFLSGTATVGLQKAGMSDCARIHAMQVKAFRSILEKYGDVGTNPGAETVERTRQRMEQPYTDYYLILAGDVVVGAVRVARMEGMRRRVAPIFVLPEHQGRGYARQALIALEKLYPEAEAWCLNTVQEEEGLCRFYESVGYKFTGETSVIQPGMTSVGYEKKIVRE